MHFQSGDTPDAGRGQTELGSHQNASPSPSASRSTGSAPNPDRECRCSGCGTTFKRSESRSMPFCGRRCQQIDLGMWLNESYGMPHEGEDAVADYDPGFDD